MKKILLFCSSISFLFPITNLQAQVKTGPPEEQLISTALHPAKSDINVRILDKFKKNYPSVTNELWEASKSGYTVFFKTGAIDNWVYLNKKGNQYGSIKFYNEQELPQPVRHMVKSAYYDYDIKTVKEVNYNGATAYLVTIGHQKKMKILRILNEELDILQEYTLQ